METEIKMKMARKMKMTRIGASMLSEKLPERLSVRNDSDPASSEGNCHDVWNPVAYVQNGDSLCRNSNSTMNKVKQIMKREVVANSGVVDGRESAVANSDLPIDEMEGDWMKISNYGVYEGSRPGRLQYFGQTEANAMAAQFHGLSGRLGRLFRGIPIYIGHPDHDPKTYTDHRRLGKYVKLEARPDGLWGEVQWNALGRENKEEGYWVYPSPRWDAPKGRKEFRPDRLISVGLTNTPRIPDSEPVTNSKNDLPCDGALALQDFARSAVPQDNQPHETMDRKKLTEKLGLDPAATDEEILAKLDSLKTAAAEKKEADDKASAAEKKAGEEKAEKETAQNSLTTAENRVSQLESELSAAREQENNAIVGLAIAEGRIAQADRDLWIGRLESEKRDEELNSLTTLNPKYPADPVNLDHAREEIENENRTREQRREAIANAVDEVQKRNPKLSREEAYIRAKRDPKNKSVFSTASAGDED